MKYAAFVSSPVNCFSVSPYYSNWRHHWRYAATYTANTMTYCVCLNTVDFHPSQITCFWATMSIVASNHLKPFVSYWHTKSSFQRISSYCVAITSVQASIAFTDSTTNVSCNLSRIPIQSSAHLGLLMVLGSEREREKESAVTTQFFDLSDIVRHVCCNAIYLVLYVCMYINRQTTLQYQTVEDVYRLLQLLASCSHYRRKDILLSWWTQSRSAINGTDQTHNETDRCARPGPIVRSPMVRSR